jgi:pyridoxine 4-dehydrogenase
MQTMKLIGRTVPRIGYGTMRLPGPNVMGPPKNRDAAIRVLQRAIELGITVIDTAWFYGPDVANELVAEALYPYKDDLIFVTKLGGKRTANGDWHSAHTPDELREGMERDLRLLKVDHVQITHLRMMTEAVDGTFKRALDTMIEMHQAGKFEQLGLSSVSIEQLDYAVQRVPIVTVSNLYNLADRHDEAMVERCTVANIAYLPFFPLAVGKAGEDSVVAGWATQLNVTPSQVALAWLLQRSPSMLPIPGTSSVAHIEENWEAGELELPMQAYEEIDAASSY